MICCLHTPLAGQRPTIKARSRHGPLSSRSLAPRFPGRFHQTVCPANAAGSQGSEGHSTEHAAITTSKQLLRFLACTFVPGFLFGAILVKDRATSPIVPPLIPVTVTTQSGPSSAGGATPCAATATAEVPGVEPSQGTAKPSRPLLRALWKPVRLVDSLLFPEEPLVGSSSHKKPRSAATRDASTASAPVRAAASSDSLSATLPAADPAAAAAGEALSGLARQVDTLAAAGQAQQPATQASSTNAAPSAFWVQLQDTVLGLAEKEQELFESAAKAAGSGSRALAAKAAAGLAALWALLGPDAMSLLPVMFVTAATAAAGLLLAASIAGVAGLVDKRRALNPAQRAAQAALLDSPLRPISCPTWPGFLPMLPASMEPTFYRWRDADPTAADAVDSAAEAASSHSSGAAQQAPATTGQQAAGAAAQVVTSAAMLAMVGAFVAPGAAGLLPVVLVTCGSAAAGLLVAASIAGVSGLVDKRQALNPAQRAAQAALLDSPLRPISCPTMPGILPMLPGMDLIFYRWRDTGAAAADSIAANSADSDSVLAGSSSWISSISTPGSKAAGPGVSAPKEHPLDQEWWSFAQIQALRLMPLLPSTRAKAGAAAGSSKGVGAGSGPSAQATTPTAPTAVPGAGATEYAVAHDRFMQQVAPLIASAPAHVQATVQQLDRFEEMGPAWEVALYAVAADSCGDEGGAAALLQGFRSTAPAGLLAEVCAALPAAAASFSAAATAAAGAAGGQDRTAGRSWQTAERLLAALLGGAPTAAPPAGAGAGGEAPASTGQPGQPAATSPAAAAKTSNKTSKAAGGKQQVKQQAKNRSGNSSSDEAARSPQYSMFNGVTVVPRDSSSSTEDSSSSSSSSTEKVSQFSMFDSPGPSPDPGLGLSPFDVELDMDLLDDWIVWEVHGLESGQSAAGKGAGSAQAKEWPEPQVPSVAEIRGLGWADGWGVAGEEGPAGQEQRGSGSSSKKGKRKQKAKQQKQTTQQGGKRPGAAATATAAGAVTLKTAAAAAAPAQGRQLTKKATPSPSPSSSDSKAPVTSTDTASAVKVEAAGAASADLIPAVKQLLGLPVHASDRTSSGDLVPNRLALLLCQAMLLRGEESQARLRAAVGYLAVAQADLQLPCMLAGCMEALFTTQDWDSPSGSARQVLSTLSAALPVASYKLLQKKLKAKGLIKDDADA